MKDFILSEILEKGKQCSEAVCSSVFPPEQIITYSALVSMKNDLLIFKKLRLF